MRFIWRRTLTSTKRRAAHNRRTRGTTMSTRRQIARCASVATIALFTTLAPVSAFAAGPDVASSAATVRDDETAAFVGEIVVGSLQTAADATQFAFDIVDAASH